MLLHLRLRPKMPLVPQVKSSLVIVAVILVGTPLATLYTLNLTGEVHGFPGAWVIIQHSMFPAFMSAVGWILFRSPFAGKITEILQQSTKTDAAGAVTQKETSIKITEPAPVPPPKPDTTEAE
jgi:hypothetical protein